MSPIRPRRVVAIAWRDLRTLGSGRGWWRLPALALGLLLPTGALPLPEMNFSGVYAEAIAKGEIPDALKGKVRSYRRASVSLSGEDPVIVRGSRLTDSLREALDTLPGEPRVRFELRSPEPPVPRRSLFLALIGVSLLTGPLAETLPGERSRNTLIALLSAAISRFELVMGKWLAWTGASVLTMLTVAVSGAFTGVQPLGWWLLGLPGAASCIVALGLWLGGDSRDAVDGAARAMRVLPVVAMILGVLAYGLSWKLPVLGPLVPLGGSLMVAGGVAIGPLAAAASLLSSGALSALLLWRTAWILDRIDDPPRPFGGKDLAVVATGALLWWLPVVAPAVWGAAGNPDLGAVLPAGAQLAAGGLLLGLYGAVEALKRHWGAAELLQGGVSGWPRGLALGVAMALGDGLAVLAPQSDRVWVQEAGFRLSAGLAPGWAGLGACLAVCAGQELFFRGVLTRAMGPVLAGLCWVLIACPLDPLRGGLSALVLGLLASRFGLVAAIAARLAWSLTPADWSLAGLGMSVVVWGLAVAAAGLRPDGPVRVDYGRGV